MYGAIWHRWLTRRVRLLQCINPGTIGFRMKMSDTVQKVWIGNKVSVENTQYVVNILVFHKQLYSGLTMPTPGRVSW